MRAQPIAAASLATFLLAACGESPSGSSSSSSSSSSSTPVQSPTATPTPGGTGPATAQLTETGSTAALTGAVHVSSVQCSLPQAVGTVIRVQSTAPGDGTVAVVLVIRAGSVVVTESSGSGQQFKSREFSGSGVTGYNDTAGAQVDSSLTETSSAGSSRGTLGALTSIKGTVSCGAFNPGSSTVTLAGTTPQGAIGGTPDTVRVTCNDSAANGRSVSVVGHVQLGSTPALLLVVATAQGRVTGFVSPTSGASHYYAATGPALATLGPGGAHIDATLTESGTGLTLKISGDANCGVTTTGP